MLKIKKKIVPIVLTMMFCATASSSIFAENKVDVTKTLNKKITYQNKAVNLESMDIQDLTKLRDSLIDKNLKPINYSNKEEREVKDDIINSDRGLISTINKKCKSLSEKDKLIKQIDFIEYIQNDLNDKLDASGENFDTTYKVYEISQYTLNRVNSKAFWKYENLKYLINHLDDLCNSVNNYSPGEILNSVDPSVKPGLSEKQKNSLFDQAKEVYKSSNLNTEIKEQLKTMVSMWDSRNDKSNKLLPNVTPAQYRTKCLAYARKHGYTNGYNGSTNEKNNAPSPYYNFQKDGLGDCANFVSQCMHTGGVQFWEGGSLPAAKEWYWHTIKNRSASWAGAKDFKIHWVNRVDYQTLTLSWTAKTLDFLRPATPVSRCIPNDGEATHTMISTDKYTYSKGVNYSYAAHTDGGNRSDFLKKLSGDLISYYKVYW